MMQPAQISKSEGFTIVELMIATAVLSVILIMATTVMISIGNLFYKGFNQSRIQDSVRTAIDDVSQDIQFEKTNTIGVPIQATLNSVGGQNYPASTLAQAYCIGNTRYSFVTDLQIGSNGPRPAGGATPQIKHVLYRDQVSGGNCNVPVDLTQDDPESTLAGPDQGTNGEELVPALTRLTAFGINPAGYGYQINVGMAYGDPNDTNGTGLATACNSAVGDQFCATDALNSQVVQR